MNFFLIVLISTLFPIITYSATDNQYITTFSCTYDASPQGFILKVNKLTNPTNSQEFQTFEIQPTLVKYTSHVIPNGVDAFLPNSGIQTGYQYLGSQQTASENGLAPNGGFYRDSNGLVISGAVYMIRGYAPAGSDQFIGTMTYIKKFPQKDTTRCSAANHIIDQLNMSSPQKPVNYPHIPDISGASQAYNNYNALVSASQPSEQNLPDMRHSDVLLFLNDDSMNTSRILAAMNGLTTGEWGDYIRIIDPSFANLQSGFQEALTTNNFSQLNSLSMTIEAKGYADYFAALIQNQNQNNFVYKPLPYLPAQPLPSVVIQDTPAIILPAGWGSEEYPQPSIPPIAGGAFGTPYVFPSALFDIPKSQAYYKGNTYHGGPAATHFKHNPLPDSCNPASDAYIPAALLNPVVLEELRLDWRYLTQKNSAALAKYGYNFQDLYEPAYWDYCIEKGIDPDTCQNNMAYYNPQLKRRPIYIKAITQATSSSTKSKQLSRTIAGINVDVQKEKLKSEAYYQDLIENKLIVMNSSYNKRACRPTYPSLPSVKGAGVKKTIQRLDRKAR